MRDAGEWARSLILEDYVDDVSRPFENLRTRMRLDDNAFAELIREAQADGAIGRRDEVEVLSQLCDALAREREDLNHKVKSLQGQLAYERRRTENIMHAQAGPDYEIGGANTEWEKFHLPDKGEG